MMYLQAHLVEMVDTVDLKSINYRFKSDSEYLLFYLFFFLLVI